MEEKNKQNLQGLEWSLKNLIEIKKWQKIQDNFSAITDVSLRTIDAKGNPLLLPSREPRLCKQLLKDHPLKDKICGWCLPTFLGGREVVDRNLSFTCHAGLCSFIAPLRAEGRVFGYTIVGPVILVMRKSKEQYKKAAEELNLDLDEFWNALLEIKVISFQGIQSVVELIKDLGEYTIKLAYQEKTKGKETVMTPDSPKLTRLLNALLEVAFQVSGADIGSIMFLDKDHLTILASRGIAEEIVRKTKVKLGDGISGIAAAERKSFLIDEDVAKDNRIKPYLNRPYLSSSMVLPISLKERVMGVINLGALKTSPVRFSSDNLKLMNKLIDLASVALHE